MSFNFNGGADAFQDDVETAGHRVLRLCRDEMVVTGVDSHAKLAALQARADEAGASDAIIENGQLRVRFS